MKANIGYLGWISTAALIYMAMLLIVLDRYKCTVPACDYQGATTQGRLDQHMVAKHGAEPYICTHCERGVAKDHEKRHLKFCKEYQAADSDKLCMCTLCPSKYATGEECLDL